MSGRVLKTFKGTALKETLSHHPFYGKGYDFDVPLLPAEHVTTLQGTGLVHTAPGHGEEDFKVGKAFNLEIPEIVSGEGKFYAHVPLFAHDHVFKVNPKIIEELKKNDTLLYEGSLTHSYPHSWRSKAPLIYRTTPQWFISLDKGGLRHRALELIDEVRWVPSQGQNRIRSMVENRPDWCLSRQRSWGVPLAIFTNLETGQPLKDSRVNERILKAIEEEGGDAWYAKDPRRFLEGLYDAHLYEPGMDCVEVWFESGASHAYVLEDRKELKSPADLYVEGSDQHRGWLQSSLLESCGSRSQAPFKTVLTHGFVLDEKGNKMSKSLGNVVSPLKIMDEMGADILRLWVVNSDYVEDLRVGPSILKHQQEIYRRFRNTLRYLLGALEGFLDQEEVAYNEMEPLEQYILHRLFEMNMRAQETLNSFDFHRFYTELHAFVAVDLSAFYFDIRKDVLYCDALQSLKRKSVQTVMNHLFNFLVMWLAPVLSFTSEEAFKVRFQEKKESVFLEVCPSIPLEWCSSKLKETWDQIRAVRRVLTGALELARSKGVIGSSLEAHLIIYGNLFYKDLLNDVNLPELAIVSQVTFKNEPIPEVAFMIPECEGLGVEVFLCENKKCERCWKMLPDVDSNPSYSGLCQRCSHVVQEIQCETKREPTP